MSSTFDTKRKRTLPRRNRHHIPQAAAQTPGPASITPQMTTPAESTSSSACPSKPVRSRPTKPFPFFELPGEIRNRIYDFAVPEARVVISANHPQRELQMMKNSEPLKKHKPPRHHLYGNFTGKPTESSLLFTCHQMTREATEYVYARTTFCFDRMVVLRAFLNVIPATARSSIQSVEIKHVGYSEPVLMGDRAWKLRHDKKWAALLRQIKQQVTALRSLDLDVTFFDWPVQLTLKESWARPFLDLAGDGLDRVNFTLEHDRFHPVKVAATAKELEKRMMSADGRKQKRQEEKFKAAEEKKRLEESKRKATKVLHITLPLGTIMSNGPAKKVVRSKGLEQYAVAQPPVAYCH